MWSVTLHIYISAGTLTDYTSDQAYYNNYPYQDYSSNYTYNYNSNSPLNSAAASGRKRRVFTTDNPMSKCYSGSAFKSLT